MDQSLTELLAEIDDETFYNENGDPDFNAIFIEVARVVYGRVNDNFSIPATDFINGTLPNLSSFQRGVSKERSRRGRQAGGATSAPKNSGVEDPDTD
jgi:hypothetical protein